LSRVSPENIKCDWLGLPVIVDPNVSTTSGGSGDYVFVLRAGDLALWEGPLETLVARETLAAQMSVIAQAWRYAAFAVRDPQSVALIGPMPAPTLGS
jgi:hypothetical protein